VNWNLNYKKCRKIRSYVPEPPVDPFKVKEAADIIDAAKRPLILFGQGVIISRRGRFEGVCRKDRHPGRMDTAGTFSIAN
jgi:thiamine pyrophosphate-dependent acetolactate synthase large subunit-like protein